MRARNLKPGFFKNEQLISLSPLHRILFEGLWCMADWKGRLEDRPGKLKIEILPGDQCDVNQMLDDLAAADHLIIRYQTGDQRLIQITNFEKHQHISDKEKQVKCLPPPQGVQDEVKDDVGTKPESYRNRTSIKPESSQNDVGSPCSTALLPYCSTALPHTALLKKTQTSSDSPKKPAKVCVYTPEFLEFWKIYPRKQEKGSAWRAWNARLKEGAQPDQLILAARHYALSVAGKDQAVMKLPATLLGPGKGPGGADPIWQEWQEPEKTSSNSSPPLFNRKAQAWADLPVEEEVRK